MSGAAARVILLAYLLGAIPFSFLLARLFAGVDIRRVGSGNIGATNLSRVLGPWAGGAGLALDLLKGIAAVLLARRLAGVEPGVDVLAGGAAILGHITTPFLRFRGGKGVATGAGVFAVLTPRAMLAALAVFVVALLLGRMVSLGSVLAAGAMPIAVYLFGYGAAATGLAALVAVLVIVRHRSNLARIVRGEERRLGAPPAAPGARP